MTFKTWRKIKQPGRFLTNQKLNHFMERFSDYGYDQVVIIKQTISNTIIYFRVNSILGMFESLDALTNSYETKDLMFNVTDYKAGKEV